MSSTAMRWLQSLVPHLGYVMHASTGVRTLRVLLVAIIAGVPAFGMVYHLEVPHLYDPAWIRASIVFGAALLLVVSYKSSTVRVRSRLFLVVITHLLMAWFFVLLVVNGLDANYALGFLFVVLAATLIHSLAWDRHGPMVMTLAVAGIYGLVAVFVTSPEPSAPSPYVFFLTASAGAIVVFIAFYGRLHIASELAQSQQSLSDAESLAQTGAWTACLVSGRNTWSDGAYRILGITRLEDPSPCFETYTHPDDVELCVAERSRIITTGKGSNFRYRVVRPDGSVRWVHAVSELVLDASNRPFKARGVIADITDQVAREDALEAARDLAEAATRSQSEFLANMSHEIRTPLTAIIGFAQMLREEVSDADAALVIPIETGGQRLLGTLNSVLDLARMKAGHADLEVCPTDLGSEVKEISRLLRPQVESRNLSLDLEVEPGTLMALVDKDAFGRILTNLFSNALKFTDEGGVCISARAAPDGIEVCVSDTGRGMTPEFLEVLFEPFRQASTGWARSHEGTGLGMTITRRLVKAMGGSITVESAFGLGSTFTVTFPAVTEPMQTQQIEAAAVVNA